MAKTKISWADMTVNPFRARHKTTGAVGHFCQKISTGCAMCYASTLQTRLFHMPPYEAPYAGQVERYLDRRVLQEVLKRKVPTRYFWCSMTDMLGEWVPERWLDECLAVMALTPHHTHILLTKRAKRLPAYFLDPDLHNRLELVAERQGYGTPHPSFGRKRLLPAFPLANLHLGVSVENQPYADERIPWLLKTPAAIRWVSYEPMLGPVDFYRGGFNWLERLHSPSGHWTTKIDGIVCGGESGPGYRPMELWWLQQVYEQCRAWGTALYVKQDSHHRNEQQGRIPDALWQYKAWPGMRKEEG